jgi:hypothetical protein
VTVFCVLSSKELSTGNLTLIMQRSQAGKYNDEKQLNQTRRLRSGKEMPEQKNKN